MESEQEKILMGKLRVIKNYFEKTYVTGASCLWLIATFWDIYKLQRYWFDYALELYTSFLVLLMIVYSIYPKAIPYKIYDSFKIITKIKGRGVLLLLISFLFLGDNHFFHRLCAIVLLIAGILCFICELLIPTTKEELLKISESYEKKRPIKKTEVVTIKNNLENNKNIEYEINNNNNNSSNIEKIDDDIKANKINKSDSSDNNENNENNDNKLPVVEVKADEGISSNAENLPNNNQSSNPYDLPDDF
jgi:hypothetical protein